MGWALVILGALTVGVTKSGFGSGAGLLVVPITLLGASLIPGFSNDDALALLLPLLAFGDIVAVWQHRRHFNGRVVLKLLPGSFVGIAIGSLLLGWFIHQQKDIAEALVNIDIGFESVFLVGLHFYRVWRTSGQLPVFRPGALRSSVVGSFAGFSSTVAHAAGPIIALHVLPQRLDKRVYVGTCAVYFLIVNSSKMPGYAMAGMFNAHLLRDALKFSPLVVLGALVGLWLNRRINDRLFTSVVYGLAFVAGVYILGKGLLQISPHLLAAMGL